MKIFEMATQSSGVLSTSLKGRTNYARLGLAAQVHLPNILRELLKFYITPKEILKECQGNLGFFKSTLTLKERNKVIDASKCGNYDRFDVPLIYKIFRNVVYNLNQIPNPPVPTMGWACQTEPAPTHIEPGDDIERIRHKRNGIIHRGNVNVEDQELDDYFAEFIAIAERFEKELHKQNHKFVSEFNNLKTLCMDEDAEKNFIVEFNLWKEREKNLLEQLEAKVISPPKDVVCVEGEDIEVHSTVQIPDSAEEPVISKVDDSISENVSVEKQEQKVTLNVHKASKLNDGLYKLKVGDNEYPFSVTVRERESCIKLRSYQHELAEKALKGENTIVCAGTNAGKTYVAFSIIESHLLKNPKGKVVFINRTNVLLHQQYSRACEIFRSLHFQGKIYKWEAGQDPDGDFARTVNDISLLFLTPQSLSNHLDEHASVKVSITDFTMLVLDECHHTYGKSPYNEVMMFYRKQKFGGKPMRLPQILGLTASPGTNKSNNISSAVDHLKKVMTNLDVCRLSFVQQHESDLLKYTSAPSRVLLRSTKRAFDPVSQKILDAMQYVESIFSSSIVVSFLSEYIEHTKDLAIALKTPPSSKIELSYIQWMAETKDKIEHVIHRDEKVPRLLHACLRHLEMYAEALEINGLLEVTNVRGLLTEEYARLSFESQNANTDEERLIVQRLKDLFQYMMKLEVGVQENPDIKEIIRHINDEYDTHGEDSRFIIFVKTRATATALAERIPDYLRSTHLTGSHVSKIEGGLSNAEQLEVVDKFRNGSHLCLVATSVACEGLDIQQCNLMIRYKFHADEISSLQMRGRIRQRGGKEVILASEKEIQQEAQNVERQYYMKEAIKRVSECDISRDILVTQEKIYQDEELERITDQNKRSQQTRGLFLIKCKFCGDNIINGHFMRHIKKKMYVVCDKDLFKRIKRVPIPNKKMKTFDGCHKRDKVRGLKCNHNWGSIIIFEDCEFVALSQYSIKIFDVQNDSILECKKWSDIKFTIDELTDQDIFKYNQV